MNLISNLKTLTPNEIRKNDLSAIPEDGEYHVRLIKGTETIIYAVNNGRNLELWLKMKNENGIQYIPFPKSIIEKETCRYGIKSHELKKFIEKTENFLMNESVDFPELKIMIDRDMVQEVVENTTRTKNKGERFRKSIREQVKWIIKSENKNKIIFGLTQTGKSPIMITNAMYYNIVYKMSVFIIVQDKNDAREQLRKRINGYFNKYKKFILKDISTSELTKDNFFNILYDERIKKTVDQDIKNAMSGKSSKIFILHRNSSDINKINEKMKNSHLKRFALIIDEADSNDKNDDESKVQQELAILKENASIIWNVTATPLETLVKEDIENRNILVMKVPEHYKDLSNVKYIPLPFDVKSCGKKEDNPFEKNPYLTEYLEQFSKKKGFDLRPCYDQIHPRISLLRIGHVVEPQMKVAKYISKNYPNVTTITYNGEGITIRGKGIDEKYMEIGDENSSLSNKIHSFKNCTISSILTYLYENGGYERYPNIIIISGRLAERGINFCSSNFEKCKRNNLMVWHLSEEYLVFSKDTDIPSIQQIAGRITGVFKDSIPLKIYSNRCEAIFKGKNCTEELVIRCKDNSDEDLTKNSLPLISLSSNKIPRKREDKDNIEVTEDGIEIVDDKDLSKLSKNFKAWSVDDDSKDGGLDWKKSFDCKRKVVTVSVPTELGEEEYKRILKLFPKWAKKDNQTNIANFIQNFDPEKEYTEKEIRTDTKNAGVRFTDCFDSKLNGKRVINGNFLQKVGNKYKLYPCLVNEFKRYF
jgi:hypothetical protein